MQKHDHLLDGNMVTRAFTIAAGTPIVLPRSMAREMIMISADRLVTETVLVRFTRGETVSDGFPILPTMPGLVLWRRLYGPAVTGEIIIDVAANTARVYIAEALAGQCQCDELITPTQAYGLGM